jgi:hypothetical protein
LHLGKTSGIVQRGKPCLASLRDDNKPVLGHREKLEDFFLYGLRGDDHNIGLSGYTCQGSCNHKTMFQGKQMGQGKRNNIVEGDNIFPALKEER